MIVRRAFCLAEWFCFLATRQLARDERTSRSGTDHAKVELWVEQLHQLQLGPDIR